MATMEGADGTRPQAVTLARTTSLDRYMGRDGARVKPRIRGGGGSGKRLRSQVVEKIARPMNAGPGQAIDRKRTIPSQSGSNWQEGTR